MLIYNNIGWINGINFILISENKPIKLRSYNGCLCFQIGKKRIGLKTWKQNAKEIEIELKNDCPF